MFNFFFLVIDDNFYIFILLDFYEIIDWFILFLRIDLEIIKFNRILLNVKVWWLIYKKRLDIYFVFN